MRKWVVLAAALLVVVVAILFGGRRAGEIAPRRTDPQPIAAQREEPTPTATVERPVSNEPPRAASPETDEAPIAPVPTHGPRAELPIEGREGDEGPAPVDFASPGLCGDDPASAKRRAETLARFVRRDQRGRELLASPDVRPEVIDEAVAALDEAAATTRGLLGTAPAAPRLVLYASRAELQQASCANRANAGFYDGELHVSGDWSEGLFTIRETVVHEYTHHALKALGLGGPSWLQEGAAMLAARETPWRDESLCEWAGSRHLDFDDLVSEPSHTSSDDRAAATYFQSLEMTRAILAKRGEPFLATLVGEIARGRVKPEEAYSWALQASDEGALAAAYEQQVGRDCPRGR